MVSTLARKAASWSAVGLLLFAGTLQAQQSHPMPSLPLPTVNGTAQTFTYHKKPTAPPVTELPPAQMPTTIVPGVRPVSLQQPPVVDKYPAPADEPLRYSIHLDPPGPQRLFGTLESEARLQARMKQEYRERTPSDRIVFPEEAVVSREVYRGRHFPPANVVVEPCYTCYGKLLFEQRNAERYGWDLGPFHPLLSTGIFFWDLAWMPYHMTSYPCRKYECSAGLCLPGDPVPLLLYPPEKSTTGWLGQAATVAALIAIFP